MRARALIARILVDSSHLVASFAVGSTVAGLALFLPFHVEHLLQANAPQRFVPDTLARLGVERAVVFASNVGPVGSGESWALFPPIPPPGLDEPLIYLQRAKDERRSVQLWRRHFPDRQAFVLELSAGRRRLRQLLPYTATGPALLPQDSPSHPGP